MSKTDLGHSIAMALLAILLVAEIASSRAEEKTNLRFAADYHQAPNCTQSSSGVSHLQPCSYEAVQVTGKKKVHYKSGPSYYLDLLTVAGSRYQVQVYRRLYQSVAPGTEMTAQVWLGKTRSLDYQSQWYKTEQNPDIHIHDSESVIEGWLLVAWVGVPGLVISWFLQRKFPLSGRASSVQARSEYPLVRDDD